MTVYSILGIDGCTDGIPFDSGMWYIQYNEITPIEIGVKNGSYSSIGVWHYLSIGK